MSFDPYQSRVLQVIGRCYDPSFTLANPTIDLSDLGFQQTDLITGTDLAGNVTAQGVVALDKQRPGCPLVALAGTKTPGQWLLDFLAVLAYPDHFCPGGWSEEGFTRFFLTLALGSGMKLTDAFSGVTGVTAGGHSLAGPLATFLAGLISADELVGFASPKPGNGTLGRWVRGRVGKITLYANAPDLVVHVPATIEPFLDFEHVNALTALNSTGIASGSVECRHNWRTYLHLIDPAQALDPACALPAA